MFPSTNTDWDSNYSFFVNTLEGSRHGKFATFCEAEVKAIEVIRESGWEKRAFVVIVDTEDGIVMGEQEILVC